MREEAMQALQNTLTSALVGKFGFETAGQIARRLRHYTEVDIQPALFIVQKNEDIMVMDREPQKSVMHLDLVLYVKCTPDQIISSSVLYNPIVDGIFDALKPKPAGERQHLNETVYQCRIDGRIETDEGTLGDQGLVLIPLSIILP